MSGIVISLLFLSSSIWAQSNHMLIMGGGGEPLNKTSTIFDQDVDKLGLFLENNASWKPKVSFNGGHVTTDMILEKGVGRLAGGNVPFTPQSFEGMISEFEMKIASGTLKAPDQLMVYISTHGAQREGNIKTHQIATSGGYSSDLTALTGAKLVSMDRLENLAKLAHSRGIKLAILDFSCHSGHTLKINNPNTCVISSTGPNHFGYSGYGGSFINNMRRGRNLEDVFLETFKSKNDRSFPMISTSVGRELNQEIYELMSQYLFTYKNDPGEDKFQKYIDEEIKNLKCENANLKFAQLQNLLNTFQMLNNALAPKIKLLQESLSHYHRFQNEIRQQLLSMKIPDLFNKKESFCSEKPVFGNRGIERMVPKCDEWTHKEIMSMNYQKLIAGYESQKTGFKTLDVQFDTLISNLKKARARRDALSTERPGYKDYENFYKKIPDLEAKTESLADDVSRKLEDLYSDLYKFRSIGDTRPNPCRKFVL
jgi:hypothetical protein